MAVQKTHLKVEDGQVWDRRVTKMTLSMYPKDVELLEWMASYLGCSQSEAFRTAIRIASTQLANLPQTSGTAA